MSTTKHTAEPWASKQHVNGTINVTSADGRTIATATRRPEGIENAARIVQCVNTCAKFPDPAAALTDLRALLGQARGLLAEGDTDRADKMLIVALGVLDGEDV